MGYESRIYIVRKSNQYDPDIGKVWAEVLMVFNLGKVTEDLEDWYREQKPTDCYIYKDDGNTVVLEDECGDPLREMDLIDCYNAISDEIDRRISHGADYTIERVLIDGVLDILMDKYALRSSRVVCLHYGY